MAVYEESARKGNHLATTTRCALSFKKKTGCALVTKLRIIHVRSLGFLGKHLHFQYWFLEKITKPEHTIAFLTLMIEGRRSNYFKKKINT